MFRSSIGGAAIINTYEIVFAARWIWEKAPIEQNDGNLGTIKHRGNLLVDLVHARNKLEGSKEDAGNPLRNVLLTKLFSDLLLGLVHAN